MRHRLVQVGVVVDDDGVLAAHLGDDLLDIDLAGMDLGGPFDDPQADLDRAGEGDQRDIRMVDQEIADDRALARDVVEDAGRQAGFAEDLHQVPADDAGEVGGLEDHRVAGNYGCRCHAQADGQGEVPGGDDRCHPLGLVEVLVDLARCVADPLGFAEADHLAGIILEEIDRLGDVGIGLVPLLADLQHLPGGQLEDPFAGRFGTLQQVLCPVAGAGVAPGREGLFGRGDRL